MNPNEMKVPGVQASANDCSALEFLRGEARRIAVEARRQTGYSNRTLEDKVRIARGAYAKWKNTVAEVQHKFPIATISDFIYPRTVAEYDPSFFDFCLTHDAFEGFEPDEREREIALQGRMQLEVDSGKERRKSRG